MLITSHTDQDTTQKNMNRMHKTHVEACGIRVDFKNQNLSQKEFSFLANFAKKKKLLETHKRMCAGAIINPTEKRQALHTALRDPNSNSSFSPEIHSVQNKMFEFADKVRSKQWTGSTQKAITDIINIGIGGSDIGVKAVWQGLQPLVPKIKLHFISAADGVHFERVTSKLNPETTLVVISSKSFNTIETLENARAIDRWFYDAGIRGNNRNYHIVIASANQNAPRLINIQSENYYKFWDWVGGRFSVWGSVGLPLAISLGPTVFKDFLNGAHAMDLHTNETPIEKNIPALLALMAFRNIQEGHISSHCFLPYDERLTGLIAWLQQLEMESLGKSTSDKTQRTGTCVWGRHGNDAQHSFYQWLRSGTANTSIDVCWCQQAGHNQRNLHSLLINSVKAQIQALAERDNKFYQNKISEISIDEFTPYRLGSLMAMYEHKTTMLGTLMGINPFDQPGVEYGKKIVLSMQQNNSSIS